MQFLALDLTWSLRLQNRVAMQRTLGKCMKQVGLAYVYVKLVSLCLLLVIFWSKVT